MAVLVLATLSVPSQMSAQEPPDSVFEFRFEVRRGMFYSPYKTNATELRRLLDCVERHRVAIESGQAPLRVDGYARSAATERANLALARERSNRVKSELIVRKKLLERHFITTNHAAEGDYVTVRLVLPSTAPETAPAVPERTPAPEANEPQPAAPEQPQTAENRPAPEAADTVTSAGQLPTEPCVGGEKKAHHLALRANLLRWATLTPDVGVEWRFAPLWSVTVSGSYASWGWSGNDRRYALWEIMPEVRRYLGRHGRGYLGAQFKAGSFNYKFSETGKQGDLLGGGLTGGYTLRLNRALNLDFGLGVGCLHADYDRYTLLGTTRVRQGSYSKNHWGVSHAGISLVWNIF